MKNFATKINPFLSAGILGIIVPLSIYAIGFVTMIMVGFPSMLSWGTSNWKEDFNGIMIIGLVLQVIAIVYFTLVLSVFSRMKIYHVLLSAVISSAVFFIVERFVPWLAQGNFPELWLFNRFYGKEIGTAYADYADYYYSFYIELNLYIRMALFQTAACALIVLVTWTTAHLAARKKRRKDEL